MHVSEIKAGEPIIDDGNWRSFVMPPGDDSSSTGYIPRDREAYPTGCYEGTNNDPIAALKRKWPRETWRERIAELERTKTRISDLLTAAPDEWLNQDPTNSCWGFGVVHMVMIVRFLANLKWARLSPYSVTGPINGYRDVGGWGSRALTFIVKHGIATTEHWPMSTPGNAGTSAGQRANRNAIVGGRKYYEGSREDAAKHTVSEFADLPDRDFAAKMACLCERIPVASGYSWMGHEMCSIDPLVMPNGDYGCRDMDHYGRGGKYNSRVLTESRAAADDAVVAFVSPLKGLA